LSRFRILASLVVLVAVAATLAACGGSDNSSEDPQQVIDNATLKGVKSGDLNLALGIISTGKEGGHVDVDLSGPFQGAGDNELPQLALNASGKGTAKGEDIDFEGGLTLLGDRAFVNYEGTEYEVDPTTFGFVKSGIERAQHGGSEGNAADVSACQEAAAGLKLGDFIDNLSNEGSADVEGTDTTKLSGDLNTAKAVEAVIKLTEDPACSAQLEAAGPLPLGDLEKAEGELSSAVKKAHVDVYVGDDDIVRRVAAEVIVEPKDTSGEKVEIDLDLTLAAVNEEQDISAPPSAKPLQQLFLKLGINPIELLEGANSGAGLGNLLEKITGANSPFGGGSSAGGGSSSGGSEGSGGGGQQAYLRCLEAARTPTDLQQCASMIQ
jgi:uncharacterized membrane protein YgcG